MPICPWCEGRGITAYLSPALASLVAGEGQSMGALKDRTCSVCDGRGTVDAETYRRWTGKEPPEENNN